MQSANADEKAVFSDCHLHVILQGITVEEQDISR